MSETTVRDLCRSLELTLRERLETIQDVIRGAARMPSMPMPTMPMPTMNTTYFPDLDTGLMARRMESLESRVRAIHAVNESLCTQIHTQNTELVALRKLLEAGKPVDNPLLPVHPIEGIEVIPKREVVIPDTEPLSFADRLLLNPKARKALEAEEMGESTTNTYPLNSEPAADTEDEGEGEDLEVEGGDKAGEEEAGEEEAEEEAAGEEEAEEVEAEAAEEEEIEAEAEEEEEEADEEEVELEEFEYKGSTYYRDPENNVFMTDEDGELVQDPIGTWSEVKQKIILSKKPQ